MKPKLKTEDKIIQLCISSKSPNKTQLHSSIVSYSGKALREGSQGAPRKGSQGRLSGKALREGYQGRFSGKALRVGSQGRLSGKALREGHQGRLSGKALREGSQGRLSVNVNVFLCSAVHVVLQVE